MKTKPKYPNKTSRRACAAAFAAVMAIALAVCTITVDDSAGPSGAAAVYTPPPPPVQISAPIVRLPDEQIVYDLYIMSMCPFGFTGLAELMDITRAFPKRQWNVWFIGRVEGNNLTSMRGPTEVFDEKLWLGVKELYPERYHEFLKQRAELAGKSKTEDLLAKMRLDVGKIRRWAEEKGADELRQHYLRSVSMQIAASPTLYQNNVKYDRNFQGGRLVRSECAAANPAPQFCADYPPCTEDSECREEGKIGRCVKKEGEPAVCEFRKDAVFNVTVLIADSPPDNPENMQIDMVKDRMPGAQVSVVTLSSDEGRRLAELHKPEALPSFYFEKAAMGALRFHTIRGMLDTTVDGGFQFKNTAVRKNYFPQRPEKTGLVELYADPMAPNIDRILGALLSEAAIAKHTVVRPVLAPTKDPRVSHPPVMDTLRAEEALRWVVLANYFPKNYNRYLKQYATAPGSSYWFNWLRPAGIEQRNFLNKIQTGQPKIEEYRQSIAEISFGETMMIMLNNQTKISLWNEQQLEQALKQISFGGCAPKED